MQRPLTPRRVTPTRIRKLNAELEEKGCLVVKGKVCADYFAERFFGKEGGANVDQ